ncbi:MAG: hypothetical protein ACNA7U_05955 [Candidatus Izemoplasmataceae bacterium]
MRRDDEKVHVIKVKEQADHVKPPEVTPPKKSFFKSPTFVKIRTIFVIVLSVLAIIIVSILMILN